MNKTEFQQEDIINLKILASQGNEILTIRNARGLRAILNICLGVFLLLIAIVATIGLIFFDKKPDQNDLYGIIASIFIMFLIGGFTLIKSLKNKLGLSKPIITLTPDGFIVPKGNKFIPWNVIVDYNLYSMSLVFKMISFKVARTVDDKELYLEKKNKKALKLFEKSIYTIAVLADGFDGYKSDQMIDLIKTYIEASFAREQLQKLGVEIIN